MPSPTLRECPFCGGPAIMREFGHHIDPYTGQHTPDIRIGCLAAFTARGDFGDDHARCPVAPMIHQISYPGVDIVAAWNKRAVDLAAIVKAGHVMKKRLEELIETFGAFYEDERIDYGCALFNTNSIKRAVAAWNRRAKNGKETK